MANLEHLAKLNEGVQAWNVWRAQSPDVQPDLSEANLAGADLAGANFGKASLVEADLDEAYLDGANLGEAYLSRAHLGGANLGGADLHGAHLIRTYLGETDLRGANLGRADLVEANLGRAHLRGADFAGAYLGGVNLGGAHLGGANLREAILYETIFANVDLTDVKGLESCIHHGPSAIDYRTLVRSGKLPLSFLQGCGLSDWEIELAKLYQPDLPSTEIAEIVTHIHNLRAVSPIQFYSCFISYTSKDEAFAKRLHADLQNKGVRCWFAPEDMKIGDKLRTRIDEVIHIHDKLLLVLSQNSVASAWVEKEVETAFGKEIERKEPVLFPIRLDASVMESKTGWAADIRRLRHIGDFCNWKNHDEYQKGLKRLLRDLQIEKDAS